MALTGRAVLLAAIAVVLMLLVPSSLAAWCWVAGVIVLVALDILLAPSPKRLVLQRDPIRQLRLGESAETRLVVHNPLRRPVRGRLRDAWIPSAGAQDNRHPVRIPPGERREYRTTLVPTRRGDRAAAAVTLRLIGPLRLAARQRSVPVPGRVRVLPAFPSRRALPSRLARLREIDGRSAVRVRGEGTEFDSLREYVDGDDVRSIDWRATARRTHLVVRTWRPERDRRIVLVLDTSRTSAGRIGDIPRLDTAMDAGLLLTALASRAGDRVQLLAGDRRVHARVIGVSDRSELMHRVVTAMSRLEPALVEADWRHLAGAVNGLSRHRALVVLLTSMEPAAVEEGLLPVLPGLVRHHRVVVASVADPALHAIAADRSDIIRTYDAAAAERTLALRSRTAAALTRLGATVLDEPPERLPVALVDHYLQLKREGRL